MKLVTSVFSRPGQVRGISSQESTITLNSDSATTSNRSSNTLPGELSPLLLTHLPVLSVPVRRLPSIGTAGVPSPTTPTDEPLCRTSAPADIPILQLEGKSTPAQQSPIRQGEDDSIASTDHSICLDLSCEGLPQPPIERLPLEILVNIFYFCIPLVDLESIQTSSYPSSRTLDAGCNLRRVCRIWKEIVDSLRTVVNVRVGICDLETGERLFDAIWPTVSGSSHQSTLFLQIGRDRPWDQAVLDKMSGMFSHFRCINIMYHPPSSSVEDLGLSFDDKRCYNLALPQDLREFTWKSCCNIHTQLPRESGLPWQKLWNAGSPETALPWSYLTYLCLDCPLAVQDCFDILFVAKKLKSVSFAFIGNKPTTQSLVVSHPELRSLKVIANDVQPFLNLLMLKSLRSLDLCTDQLLSCTFPQVGAIPWNILERLVVRCDVSLKDMRKLLAWCTALKHFEWYCPRDAPPSWLTTLDLGPLSSVTIHTDSPTANVKPLITCLNKSLQQTAVLNLPYIPDFILQSVICPDITTVNVTKAISDRDCWLVFRSCPRLRVLALFINKSDFTFTRYLESSLQLASTSHHLASLAIRSAINLEPLLRCLTLPRLTTLCWDWELSVAAIFGALQSLLLRSSCPLHRLCLINAYPVADVLPCLKVVNTSLTELTIDNKTSFDLELAVTNDLLCHLTHGEGDAHRCLCPRLRVITFSPVLSDDQVLATMVRSRWTRGFDTERCQSCNAAATFCDLESLTVGFGLSHEPLHVHPLDRSELAGLRKQGLILQLR